MRHAKVKVFSLFVSEKNVHRYFVKFMATTSDYKEMKTDMWFLNGSIIFLSSLDPISGSVYYVESRKL